MDAPEPANPHVVGNVGAVLATHLIACLLRKGVLDQTDVAAIFQETQMRYTTRPAGQEMAATWVKQAREFLALLREDALSFGSNHPPSVF